MHNPDDKYPTRLEFEPSTSEFRAKTGPNEPSGTALGQYLCGSNTDYTLVHIHFGNSVAHVFVDLSIKYEPISLKFSTGNFQVILTSVKKSLDHFAM